MTVFWFKAGELDRVVPKTMNLDPVQEELNDPSPQDVANSAEDERPKCDGRDVMDGLPSGSADGRFFLVFGVWGRGPPYACCGSWGGVRDE